MSEQGAAVPRMHGFERLLTLWVLLCMGAGILLGRRDLIDAMRQNPLARALRVDKLTVAALDATLELMLDESRADENPVVAGLLARSVDLERRASRLFDRLTGVLGAKFRARVAEGETAVGGGSLPEHRLSGWAVVVEGPRISAVAAGLRAAPDPVVVRVHDDALWFDVRTLRDEEFPIV